MPHFYSGLPPHLAEWAMQQPMFFTASAPRKGSHINVSPKGLTSSTFTVFDANHAAYLDATGSGAETIAHLYDNGRMTVMFNSFTKKPRIMRLFCTGRVVESSDPKFGETVRRMGKEPEEVMDGIRAVILLDIWKVQTACGYAVPTSDEQPREDCDSKSEIGESAKSKYLPDNFQDRDTLTKWLKNKVRKNALDEYKVQNNARSLDNLLGLRDARRMKGEYLWLGDIRAWMSRELDHGRAILLGALLGALFALVLQHRLLQA